MAQTLLLNGESQSWSAKARRDLDEVRPESARTVIPESLLHAERRLGFGPTSPPEEQDQEGVEAEPESERASKRRRVTELDVVEKPEQDIENQQPGTLDQEAAHTSGTLSKELNSGESN